MYLKMVLVLDVYNRTVIRISQQWIINSGRTFLFLIWMCACSLLLFNVIK